MPLPTAKETQSGRYRGIVKESNLGNVAQINFLIPYIPHTFKFALRIIFKIFLKLKFTLVNYICQLHLSITFCYTTECCRYLRFTTQILYQIFTPACGVVGGAEVRMPLPTAKETQVGDMGGIRNIKVCAESFSAHFNIIPLYTTHTEQI